MWDSEGRAGLSGTLVSALHKSEGEFGRRPGRPWARQGGQAGAEWWAAGSGAAERGTAGRATGRRSCERRAARRLKARHDGGERLHQCQIDAYKSALKDAPRTDAEIEAELERLAIQMEAEDVPV